MGKSLKIILSILAALILLLIVIISALFIFIDPNDFKPEIQAAVKDRIGRELTLEGDLNLSIFPWLGISTGKMTLSNAEGFQTKPFAEIQESDINVKLLPLLSKEIEVDRIVLKGLTVNLAKNKQGVNNWHDLIGTKPEPSPAPGSVTQEARPTEKAQTLLSIGGITLENAFIDWDNQKSGKHLEIKDVNLGTDKIVFDEPFAVDLALTIVNAQAKLTESIKLTADLTVNEKLDNFQLTGVNLQSTTAGEKVPGKSLKSALTAANVLLNMAKQDLKISTLRVESGDLKIAADITGTRIKDQPSFQGPVAVEQFNPVLVMKQLEITPPVMRDANALTRLAMNFNLQATDDAANLQDLLIKLDDTTINGSASVDNFSQPAIAFNLTADALDADRYLTPEKEADKNSKPIASPAVTTAAAASLLPVETLRKLNANGELTLHEMKINNLNMQDIHLKLSAKNGIVTTQQSVNQFYQGNYSGNMNMDVRNKLPVLAVNEKISHVQVEPLLKDYKGEAKMSGVVNMSAQLQAQGNNKDEIKSSLNGQLNFLFKDSVILGFNLQKIIDNSKALIKGAPLPADSKNDQTLFSEMTGTATINNGVLSNNDLVAYSSKLRVNGKGSANLNTDALNYKIKATLLKSPDADGQQAEKMTVAVNFGGTLSKPSYTVDPSSLLTEENKAKIEEKKQKLLDKLDKKLGPGTSDLLKRIF
ncbi:AsmA family protein [Methylobacter sp. YRD-M1]|uniref:AsmA family protein n=1 Tax=Methylobacter sp. YRD-M1 TaxID=2911520 RepID=UPI00227C00C5|nr:AsmA family protein [Methylobacter sp. YRD-M1]WAK02172.1 AsmA family protein [Methylobacter sp. YRD-M1]